MPTNFYLELVMPGIKARIKENDMQQKRENEVISVT